MNEWSPGGIALIVTALLGTGGFGAWFNARRPKGSRENALLDQYQEHSLSQDAKIDRLEERMDASYKRERIRDDYIAVLRQHIADGKPPPPPPFPPGLIGGDVA